MLWHGRAAVNVLSKRFQDSLPKPSTDSPTLETVARLAKVSVASASRALNGIRTTPETLARVTAAAEAIGYAPNAAARSLRSRKTGQIGFAMPDIANPVYAAMAHSIQQTVQEKGCRLMLHSTEGDVCDELALLADLKQRYVDGLILCTLNFTDAHAAVVLRQAPVPVALIAGPTPSLPVDTVRANSRRGAADAVRHLHGVGRRRIAFINGPVETVPGRSRRLGYLDGLRASGLERNDELVEVASDFTLEPGRLAAERLLARACPDAILCANDLLALGALAAIRSAGLSIPGDVAIVGMDDTSFAAVSSPPLTSVDLGSAERGRIAAELLLKRIDRPGRRPRSVGVQPRLVVRESSGAVA
jgi:LacI family transcriptional regulator, galactose operon repressor